MKHILTTIAIFFFVISASGQKQANIWYFGDHAGLDFNYDPPTPLLDGQTDFPPPNEWNEGCSSISDSSGSLLFYTNGMKIWNRLQQVMPNGSNLMGHSSSTESSIIVPQPNSQEYFYVFTTDASEDNFQNGLRYSVVDMCLDNSNGDVIPSLKNILLTDTVAEKLIAVRHSNGTDYWIVTHKFNSDAFYSFRLTSNGVVDTIISHTGTTDPQGWGGQMIASPNGQKIAYAIPSAESFGKTLLLSFDASTGVVSNEQTLSTGGREWGVSFSPDNSKLYFSTAGFGQLFQYNLNEGDLEAIIASKTFIISNGPDSWRHHQLGPDGKIYISRTMIKHLSLIEFPDSLCPACNYIDSAIYLGGKNTSFGLPNFVANFSYSNTITQCHTGIDQIGITELSINVYPSPANQAVQIELPKNLHFNLTIVDVTGKLVYSVEKTSNLLEVNCSTFCSGLYFIKATNDKSCLTGKFVKE